VKALDMLGDKPFITTSSDVFTDYDYAKLHAPLAVIARGEAEAHFVLADNPLFHREGDFAIRDGFATRTATSACPRLNYASMSCWHPQLFADLPVIRERLFPWADTFVSNQRVTAEYFSGCWENIGTVEHLARLQQQQALK
jgi:N-acetyl-alpha-D-muramate 1-phosphate uridylyltransferase